MAELACRARDGVHVYAVDQREELRDLTARAPATTKLVRYSADGVLLGWSTDTTVVVVDASTGATLLEQARANVVDFRFSPLNTFVATWQRPASTQEGQTPPDNVSVIRVASGECVLSSFSRSMVQWAPQWTKDEVLLTRVGKNEIQVFNGRTIVDGVQSRIRIEGVTHAELAPGPAPYKVAAFTPEKKGAPGSVRMYACEAAAAPLAMKSFFKADKVDVLWNENGSKALVLSQTEVDMSGKSYFGETNLYYLDASGKFDCHVTLDKDGPIHEVTWSPNGREFVVVYGFMPAKAKLFDTKCSAIFDFGAAGRNAVQYNPQGTIICLAGFGNLAGEIEFWSRETLKRVSVIQARDTTYFDWCPDGRHVLTAILSPRLRVDNGFRVFHYNGHVVCQGAFKELYQVAWRPARYPARPVSPVLAAGALPPVMVVASFSGESPSSSPAGSTASGSAVAPAPAPAKKAAYVPPHLRGQAGAAAPVGPRKLHELLGENVDQGSSASSASSALAAASAAGGDEALSKAALKNKKKREAKRGAGDDAPAAPAAPATPAAPAGPAGPSNESDLDKKIRNLTKKIRQIELLQEQQREGKPLEANQVEKIKTYGGLVAELGELQKLGAR